MLKLRAVALLAAAVTSSAVVSCEIDPTEPNVDDIAAVHIAPDSVGLVAVGQTVRLEATARDGDGREIPTDFFWISLDDSVASVTVDGTVTAVGNGSTRVIASANGLADTARIVVAQVASSIVARLSADTVNAVGDSVRPSVDVFDAGGTVLDGVAVVWSSLDTTIAYVTQENTVVARAPGIGRIVAHLGSLTDTVAVVVRQIAAHVVVLPSSIAMLVGDTAQVMPTVLDSNAVVMAEATVEFVSLDAHLVETSGSYLFGVSAGTARVRVSSGPAADTIRVVIGQAAATRIVAGTWTTCALTEAGLAYCWGRNSNGQFGNGNSGPMAFSPRPTRAVADLLVRDIAIGPVHGCAITMEGHIRCWGRDNEGQLGDLAAHSTVAALPVEVAGLVAGTRVTVGSLHSCAIAASGVTYCWGSNQAGALGVGKSTSQLSRSSTPQLVDSTRGFTSLSAGASHTCALSGGGTAYCWGGNGEGQLGTGGTSSFANAPVAVAGDFQFVSIAAGSVHTCAVASDQRAYCWGASSKGQLGTGSSGPGMLSRMPVQVALDVPIVGIAAGTEHSCALGASGEAWCWGNNDSGQLGDGTRADRPVPATVVGAPSFVAITAGEKHTCAIAESGIEYCWGARGGGLIGDGSTGFTAEPQHVQLPEPIDSIESGLLHTCALSRTGNVYCWGADYGGALGDGTGEEVALTPVRALLSEPAVAIFAGNTTSCAIGASFEAWCWGWNGDGQVGDSTLVHRSAPVRVAGGRSWSTLSVGFDHTCGIASGEVYCWGGGVPSASGNFVRSLVPLRVSDDVLDYITETWDTSFTAIVSGWNHSCALRTHGIALCWGANPVVGSALWKSVQGFAFASLSAGWEHMCGLATDGSTYCWGSDRYGQLGSDAAEPRETSPRPIAPDPQFSSITSGEIHDCGLNPDGYAFCWGNGGYGQLGTLELTEVCDGSSTDEGTASACSRHPVRVGDLRFADVTTGYAHTCGVALDGQVFCWGWRAEGLLGDGTEPYALIPSAAEPK